jgi:hypothetical protein
MLPVRLEELLLVFVAMSGFSSLLVGSGRVG